MVYTTQRGLAVWITFRASGYGTSVGPVTWRADKGRSTTAAVGTGVMGSVLNPLRSAGLVELELVLIILDFGGICLNRCPVSVRSFLSGLGRRALALRDPLVVSQLQGLAGSGSD